MILSHHAARAFLSGFFFDSTGCSFHKFNTVLSISFIFRNITQFCLVFNDFSSKFFLRSSKYFWSSFRYGFLDDTIFVCLIIGTLPALNILFILTFIPFLVERSDENEQSSPLAEKYLSLIHFHDLLGWRRLHHLPNSCHR